MGDDSAGSTFKGAAKDSAGFAPYRALIRFLPRLWSNWITLLGSVVVSAAAVTILVALTIDLTSSGLNAYATAILFLVMPALMLLGLILIPVGLWRDRARRRARSGAPGDPESVEDAFTRAMENQTVRRRVGFVLFLTLMNILIFSTVTYRAVTFMETPEFCGTTCHKVMQPEYDAYNQSPHSRVACVACHIGSGAPSMIQAKLSGLRQVWGVATGHFHRPIETPVHNLRPARETCANCHQPNRQSGNRLAFRVHFKPDETNTPQVTAMMFHLGGEDRATGEWSGIHVHASTRFQIRYEVLDDHRDRIGKIQKVEGDRVVKEWLPAKPDADAAVKATRTMDCTDCHNRATHIYDESPEAAVTRALVEGRLDRKIPWIYAVSAGVLASATPPRDRAKEHFRQALETGYAERHAAQKPSAQALDQSADALAALYLRNVYPDMNLTWGNYRSRIGHGGADPGNTKAQCFRCHSGEHRTADGQELSGKCELCHEIVAKDELPADLPDEIQPLFHL
jgi:nitrate/TMAO reductase-like tetraheme cytochrome c subunit